MKRAKTIGRTLWRAVPFFLIAAVFFSLFFYPEHTESEATEKRVVRIWNVDTFAGGKGSRTSYLKKVARKAETSSDGVYYLVSSVTPEGAKAAFAEGDFPDLLSFGVGLSDFAELSLPLSVSFAGGNTESGCLAYPWCRGGYALFSLTENFSETGTTAVSVGGSNLSEVAAALAGIEGEETEALAAYTGFLNGKFRYLLGTQRDLCRFSARNVAVYYRPLPEFCDLYQYISVLSAEKRSDCDLFVRTLLSEEAQSTLSEIGMFPIGSTDGFLGETPKKTLSVFSSDQSLALLKEAARRKDIKSLENYLKNI